MSLYDYEVGRRIEMDFYSYHKKGQGRFRWN